VPSAAEQLHAEIAAAGGAIPFRRFMDLALYGPGGFYTEGGRAGRRGDFLTSPEVGPLFGAVLGRALDRWWASLGRPDPFTVVDAGAGPGTLARSVLAAAPACRDALDYVAVEISEHQRALHPGGITSRATLPDVPFTGVILANELLDNLPFRLFVWDGGWREAYVASDGDRFVEVLVLPEDGVPPELPAVAPHGARAPVQADAQRWVVDALSCLQAGWLVVVDYAVAVTASLAQRPWREWLRTYRGHERGGHYLAEPGTQDITCEVAMDQLVRAAGEPAWVRTQAQALQLWGIDDLVAEGKRVWAEQAARPGLEALKMRSRVSEAEALLDPTGLGAFTVAAWPAPHPASSV
jgi:SAM-dependent MidA family methyltransferase